MIFCGFVWVLCWVLFITACVYCICDDTLLLILADVCGFAWLWLLLIWLVFTLFWFVCWFVDNVAYMFVCVLGVLFGLIFSFMVVALIVCFGCWLWVGFVCLLCDFVRLVVLFCFTICLIFVWLTCCCLCLILCDFLYCFLVVVFGILGLGCC